MTRYVTLAEYFWLAEQVTGVDADTLTKASRSDLADSALHAPQAGFGDVEFYLISATRPLCWFVGWRGTTHFPTGTSVRRGRGW